MDYCFDSHTHSNHSHDGVPTVEQMAQSCQKRGIAGFSLTNHCDVGFWNENDYVATFEDAYRQVQQVGRQYKNSVEITMGVELGEVLRAPHHVEHMLRRIPFDFVIHSLHILKGREDFYLLDYPNFSEQDIHDLIVQYFEEFTEEITWGGGDVAGHITLPLRYLKLGIGLELDLRPYQDYVDTLLRTIIDTGMGIEINTSGWRTAHGEPMPSLELARRYLELGGEIVTIGSDAHRAEHIGSHIKEGKELLRQAGFRYYAIFHKRKPEYFPL